MSDYGTNERRHDATARSEADTRERLIRVETNLETLTTTTTEEVGRVRERVHELVEKLTPLVLLAGEAKEERDRMSAKIDRINDKLDPAATSQATLATTLAMHMGQCAIDKAAFADAIDRLKRTVWMASGGLSALWLALTVGIAFFKR